MKILHLVESYLPSRHGMSEVVSQISERLVQQGHSVTVATRVDPARKQPAIRGVDIVEFAISGNMVRGFDGEAHEVQRYRDFLCSSRFDVVGLFAAQQWSVDLALPLLAKIRGKKVFVPTGFSALFEDAYQGYFAQMPAWMNACGANVFLSDCYRDINFAKRHGVSARIVIPNGASEEEFLRPPEADLRQKLGIPADHRLILHVGGFTGQKGHREAVEYLLPRGDQASDAAAGVGRLRRGVVSCRSDHPGGALVVGAATKLRRRRRTPGEAFHNLLGRIERSLARHDKVVRLVKLARPDVVAAFQGADLFLFPSNIECSPIVLFEAMAARCPFLATNVGNSREIAGWSKSGIILPTTTDAQGYVRAALGSSAEILTQLLADRTRLAEMAEAGFRAWRERFTWEGIAQSYETLYARLVSGENYCMREPLRVTNDP